MIQVILYEHVPLIGRQTNLLFTMGHRLMPERRNRRDTPDTVD